jgi:predicted nucleic acid-binding protein
MVCYYDSSVILAILLDEPRKIEAKGLWISGDIRISSLLLKLETITVLRRTYEHNSSKLDSSWLTRKTIELSEFMKEVNFRVIDSEIDQIIHLRKDLAKCRTLDAIHMATAIDVKKSMTEELSFFSFDRDLLDLARSLRFKTNTTRPEEAL